MRKIKNFIIHLLGGFTLEERESDYIEGFYWALKFVEHEMRANYGKPSTEWCNNVWKCVSDLMGHYEDNGNTAMEWCNNVWKRVNDLMGHYEDR